MKRKLKIGDLVIMTNCSESGAYKDRIWKVRSDPWDLCGSEVVLLEGRAGGFATKCLYKVNAKEKTADALTPTA